MESTNTDKSNDVSNLSWNLQKSTDKSSSSLSANENRVNDSQLMNKYSLSNKQDEGVSITQDSQKDEISSNEQKESISSESNEKNQLNIKGNHDNIECYLMSNQIKFKFH